MKLRVAAVAVMLSVSALLLLPVSAGATFDAALSQPCQASSEYSSSYSCDKAFDGEYGTTTRWAVHAGQILAGNWLEVDIGTAGYVVTQARVIGLSGSSGCPTGSCWAAHYKVQSCKLPNGFANTCNASDPQWTDRSADQDGITYIDHTFSVTASNDRYWRLWQLTDAYGLWTVGEFELDVSGAPAHIAVTPGYTQRPVGTPVIFTLQAVDGTGADITTGDAFTVTSAGGQTGPALGRTATCDGTTSYPHTFSGSSVTCSAAWAGDYVVRFADVSNLTTSASIRYIDASNQFILQATAGCSGCAALLTGQQSRIYDVATDSTGQDRSASDVWTIQNTDSHRTCVNGGGPGPVNFLCSWDASGDYTVTGKDQYGFVSSIGIHVGGTGGASAVCGSTDLGCYLTQIWDSITGLAFGVAQAIGDYLFVSKSGRNYIDLSNLFQLPAIACRGGEFPTHPDGVHCLPFPFAILGDVSAIAGILSVAPVAPSLPARLHAPPIDYSFTIDPTVVLTPTIMTYVKAVEYVGFIVGLALGTYRFVQGAGAD